MKQKYRIVPKSDGRGWMLLVPVFGFFMMLFDCMFPTPTVYKVQKRFMRWFWITQEEVEGTKEAQKRVDELNGIHHHRNIFVYFEDRLWNTMTDNDDIDDPTTIIRVEYCPECGEILSKKHAHYGAYASHPQAIRNFERACHVRARDVSMWKKDPYPKWKQKFDAAVAAK